MTTTLAVPLQEDAHSAVLDLDASTGTGFFGVFDGHGGKEVAKYAALHLASPRLCCTPMPYVHRAACACSLQQNSAHAISGWS